MQVDLKRRERRLIFINSGQSNTCVVALKRNSVVVGDTSTDTAAVVMH